MKNRLADETSPYLLQHANNPVDWYPWGDDAFARARAEDQPILLSVGYSACHWCHVMERESFENEAIAALMNANFVNVKVDREERPDVDAIYMSAVQMLTGQGGWPMTMFLTPDGRPFYGGTYFPPESRYGRPGFPDVLEAVTQAWTNRRDEVLRTSDAILHDLNAGGGFGQLPDSVPTPAILDTAFETLASQYDPRYGGFGNAPKFPQPANLELLLRYCVRSRREEPLSMVEHTLQQMAFGGIYDQLGGGFHRYSTDRQWIVPHFEKMLYDNAQLAVTLAHAYQITSNPIYRRIAEETLEYVLREMTGPEGGFYSAQDADSEGEEGKFFVWTPDEVRAILGDRDAEILSTCYDVTPQGNFEGKCILRDVVNAADAARHFTLTEQQITAILKSGRERMFAVREHRVKPALDDKVLTAWNGLMLRAFAECGAIFDRPDFVAAAVKNAEFVTTVLSGVDDGGRRRLKRAYRGGKAHLNGYLEDYAFYADGLLALYEATFDARWLTTARELIDSAIALFADEADGGFFATSSDHETLIQRPKDWDDNATPSGNSVIVELLIKFAILFEDESYRSQAARVLRKMGPVIEKHPYSFPRLLGALDLYLSTPKEIALVGALESVEMQPLIDAVRGIYLPNSILVAGSGGGISELPVLLDREPVNGKPTAYVCENYVCKLPVTDADALRKLLTG